MNRSNALAASLLLTCLVGCKMVTTEMRLKQVSIGQVGCPAEDLVVSDIKDTGIPTANGFSKTWVVTCRGHRFLCSEAPSGANDVTSSCKEELQPVK